MQYLRPKIFAFLFKTVVCHVTLICCIRNEVFVFVFVFQWNLWLWSALIYSVFRAVFAAKAFCIPLQYSGMSRYIDLLYLWWSVCICICICSSMTFVVVVSIDLQCIVFSAVFAAIAFCIPLQDTSFYASTILHPKGGTILRPSSTDSLHTYTLN